MFVLVGTNNYHCAKSIPSCSQAEAINAKNTEQKVVMYGKNWCGFCDDVSISYERSVFIRINLSKNIVDNTDN